MEEVAVHRGRHLHLRRLPRLPHPAQPQPHLGRHPGRPRLAAAADRARPAGVVPAALPALQGRLQDLAEPHRRLRHGGRAGCGRGRQERRRRDGVRHRRGQHDLVRPRGLQPRTTPTAASPPWSSRPRWVTRIKALGYVAGFYSSASSGIKMLDDARTQRPGQFALPDRIWIARWDGAANTSTTYIPEDGWRPGGRMKQYLGGHNETWGGVTINIDSNFIDLGAGSQPRPEGRCPGTRLGFWKYPALSPASAKSTRVKALQCLLTEQGTYSGPVNGSYDAATDRRRARLAGRPQVHPEQHLREAALDRAARRRSPYDGQARVGRRVGAPAPAGAQRGRRRALPGDAACSTPRPRRPCGPTSHASDRRLGRRHAPDLEQAAAGSLTPAGSPCSAIPG